MRNSTHTRGREYYCRTLEVQRRCMYFIKKKLKKNRVTLLIYLDLFETRFKSLESVWFICVLVVSIIIVIISLTTLLERVNVRCYLLNGSRFVLAFCANSLKIGLLLKLGVDFNLFYKQCPFV